MGKFRDYSRTILGQLWEHFGTIVGPFRDHFGTNLEFKLFTPKYITGTYFEGNMSRFGRFAFGSHLGTILRPLWEHFGTILGPFWDYFGTILRPFWGPF